MTESSTRCYCLQLLAALCVCVCLHRRGCTALFLVIANATHDTWANIPLAAAQKIIPVNGAPSELFGRSLAIDGDTLVIGSGRAAYVYGKADGNWEPIVALRPSDGLPLANSIAIDGSTIIAADYQHSIETTEGRINFSGAAYIFEESAEGWAEVDKLVASDANAQGYFGGGGIAVSGDTLIVGTGSDDVPYVFENISGLWEEQSRLSPFHPDFALSANGGPDIAFAGNVVLVGAHVQDVGNLVNSGTVFAFEKTVSGWVEIDRLVPSAPVFRGNFGFSLDVSGDTVIIGRPAGGPAATGPFRGAAYIFEKNGTQWVESAKLQPSDGFENDMFGARVEIEGNLAAVSTLGREHGTVYLFEKSNDTWREVNRITSAASVIEVGSLHDHDRVLDLDGY